MTRRQFLLYSSLSLAALAARRPDKPIPAGESPAQEYGLGRVIASRVTIRTDPDPNADKVYYRYADRVLNLQSLVESQSPPDYNRAWYKVEGGYVHSGYIQPVGMDVQRPLEHMPDKKFLAEVTVPFVDSRKSPYPHSEIGYRHYYGTTHWVTGLSIDPQGTVWYRLWDDKLNTVSYVLGRYLRPVPAAELSPLSPMVTDKLLTVDTRTQWARAYENGAEVFRTRTATGDFFTINGVLKDFTTPTGSLRIDRKTPSRHMAAGDLAAGAGYDLPGVPWVSYFTYTGAAFHGTYWHNDYGRPRSHGCVNVTSEAAKWIYRWSLPWVPPGVTYLAERGTAVIVT
jgi:hypothetical protein